MQEDRYDEGIRKAKKSGIRPFLPVLGLLLGVALGGVSYALAPTVLKFVAARIPDLNPEDSAMQLVFTGIIFLVLISVSALIFTMAAPKPKTDKLATEGQLKKEKAQKQKEMLEAKKRKREIQRKLLEENRRRAREEAERRNR